MFLSTIPVAPMMTGMTSTFLFHSLWHSIWQSTYLLIIIIIHFIHIIILLYIILYIILLFILFILAKAQLFPLSFLNIEEEPPTPRSTHWGAYRSATSCGAVHPSIWLQSHTFTHFTHSYLVGRGMVVGHILMVHICSFLCTNHIDMTAHTPPFLYQAGYYLYICGAQHSWA